MPQFKVTYVIPETMSSDEVVNTTHEKTFDGFDVLYNNTGAVIVDNLGHTIAVWKEFVSIEKLSNKEN